MRLPSAFKTPFARQCYGALLGAALALGLYNASTWSYAKVEAMLIRPETKAEVTDQARDAKLDRIAADVKSQTEKQ